MPAYSVRCMKVWLMTGEIENQNILKGKEANSRKQ